jgi:hypothetical protein
VEEDFFSTQWPQGENLVLEYAFSPWLRQGHQLGDVLGKVRLLRFLDDFPF